MKVESLKDKVAIITGAGRGMGAEIARTFAQNGVKVVLNDLISESLEGVCNDIAASGGHAVYRTGDISREADVVALVKFALNEFKTVHIMINNAGILRPTRIENITTEEYDRVVDVSMKSCFLCSREVIPILKKQRWGRIINMSSSAGRSVSTLGGCHYTAAKAGMLGLTRAIAKEIAPFNITVNAVCPGLIDTEMVRRDVAPEKLRRYLDSFPIPRLGTPEEVAQTFLFLASEEAAYITGASIDINGGDLML
jgi:NAD(P)-dependent dehydrogenase (short-subunit alcohol dehydrogenase family)